MSKTVLTSVSLLALAIPCLANGIPISGGSAQQIKPQEAIVVSIDKSNVTLQSAEDKDKKLTAPFSNAAEFKAGDKVVLIGSTLKKASADDKTAPTANKL